MEHLLSAGHSDGDMLTLVLASTGLGTESNLKFSKLRGSPLLGRGTAPLILGNRARERSARFYT